MADPTAGVTALLVAWRAGDAQAPARLAELVYAELHAMAARRLASTPRAPLQTTELAHEAFARLLEQPLDAVDRTHFFRIAGLALRQALVDALRRAGADKRGGHVVHVGLSQAGAAGGEAGVDWLAIEDALAELDREDPRKCRAVELTLLLGLEQEQAAAVLGVSLTTIERDLRFARAWLRERLEP
jgi:RNA polymerase sigma factor (TIGR02999 family)